MPVAVAAADAYLALRARAPMPRAQRRGAHAARGGELAAEREAVKALWKAVFGGV